MCGIAGILSLDGGPVGREELWRMCAALTHRGPDDAGFYLGGGAGLGMRRLSIIDLATGRQPVHNEDRSIWAVFNGEIYNFRELRRDLEARGHRFYTQTDTETIVHLYEERGTRCAEPMRGMFAFAVWDERQRRLLLARDRLGIKPLFYAQVGGRLLFASELKAILALPEVERRLDWNAVNHVFTFLSSPAAQSIVAGVSKLEPAHVLTASPGGAIHRQPYWDLSVEPDYGRSEEEQVEALREALRESVRLHLVSDVPLGAFLSGGIDSSSVVATMAPLVGRPVKTFAIGFREADYNELGYARLAARELGTEHYELTLEPDVVGILEDLTWHLDEPLGDASAIPTYMVSKLAAQHVKVVLSGDGGDELFAGYDKYRVEQKERAKELPAPARWLLGALGRRVPEGMRGRNLLRHLALSGPERYFDACTLFNHQDKGSLFRPEALALFSSHDPWREAAAYLARANGHWLTALQYLDFKTYLPLDILPKVDRMSMAHSIEARVPLLDHKLVELVARIPPELKLRGGTAKYVLKRAMEGILPPAILDRPKQGFAIPLGQWFRGQLADFVRELLLAPRARQRGIFNPAYVESLLNWWRDGRRLDMQIWTLISFELWCRAFLDRGRPAEVEDRSFWRRSAAAGPGLESGAPLGGPHPA